MSHYHGVSLEAIIQELCASTPEPPHVRRWWHWFATFGPTPAKSAPQRALEWTPQRLLTYLNWLPDNSACAASLSGGKQHRGWGQDRWLAAKTFDAIQNDSIVALKIAAGKKAGRIKQATMWPGPDEQAAQTERLRPKVSVSALPKFNLK